MVYLILSWCLGCIGTDPSLPLLLSVWLLLSALHFITICFAYCLSGPPSYAKCFVLTHLPMSPFLSAKRLSVLQRVVPKGATPKVCLLFGEACLPWNITKRVVSEKICHWHFGDLGGQIRRFKHGPGLGSRTGPLCYTTWVARSYPFPGLAAPPYQNPFQLEQQRAHSCTYKLPTTGPFMVPRSVMCIYTWEVECRGPLWCGELSSPHLTQVVQTWGQLWDSSFYLTSLHTRPS